jgi:predicted sulfurtransferase
MGTFKNAIDFNIKSFRKFPDELKKSKIPKDATIVTFCTGGIRCEKAGNLNIKNFIAPYLISQGNQLIIIYRY